MELKTSKEAKAELKKLYSLQESFKSRPDARYFQSESGIEDKFPDLEADIVNYETQYNNLLDKEIMNSPNGGFYLHENGITDLLEMPDYISSESKMSSQSKLVVLPSEKLSNNIIPLELKLYGNLPNVTGIKEAASQKEGPLMYVHEGGITEL